MSIETQRNEPCALVDGVLWCDALSVWPRIAPLIDRCLRRFDSGYSLEDLLTAIQLRDKQLWLIDGGKAAGITSIVILPQWKKLVVEYLAGDAMADWQDAWFDAMHLYAEANHCKYIEVFGREGWLRMAKSRGDRVQSITVSRKCL